MSEKKEPEWTSLFNIWPAEMGEPSGTWKYVSISERDSETSKAPEWFRREDWEYWGYSSLIQASIFRRREKPQPSVASVRLCGACRWWESWASGQGGECHRMPPQVQTDGEGCWPVTLPADYCGEWEEKGKP